MSSLPPTTTNPMDNEFNVVEDVRLQRMLEMSRDVDMPAPKLVIALDAEEIVEEKPKPKTRWQKLLKLPRRTWLLIGGTIALVVIALLAGVLIGSSNRPTTAAWQVSPAYEKMYLAMVADKYAKTGDLAQLQRDLAGASPEQVAQILQTMQRETNDATTRQRLTVLSDAVRPPVTQTSYMPSLISQPAFLFSLFLSLTPMFVAFGLVIAPYLRERLRSKEDREKSGERISPETAEAMLEAAAAVAPAIDPNAPVAGASVAAEPTPEAAAAAAAAAEEEQKKKEEEEEEEEQQQEDSGGLGDLASLFEEEDTSLAALENFCKGLPDLAVDVLLSNAKNAVQELKVAIARRR